MSQNRGIGRGHRGHLRRRSEWQENDGLFVADKRGSVSDASPDPRGAGNTYIDERRLELSEPDTLVDPRHGYNPVLLSCLRY